MWKQVFYLSLTLLFLDIDLQVYGQEGLNRLKKEKQNIKSFETFVENIIKCRKVTGAAITMVKENKVIFKKGFGYENIEKGVLATENTKFCIGSLTKAFTSTLLAKLLDKQDIITWDTPIRDILGNSFKLTDSLRTNYVNLRDLLSHKVGTPPFFNALLVGFPETVTRAEFVRNLEYQPAVKPFRTSFLYSNYMYTLAGYIAEKIGKKTWESLVNEMLFEPLSMCRSGFIDTVKTFDGYALPYAYLNGTAVALDMMLTQTVNPSGPAGSIYSTAEDMGKWIMLHLDKLQKMTGKRDSLKGNIFETYTGQMPTPFKENDWYQPTNLVDDISVSYNMGWITSVYRGFRRFWHTGGILTYSSFLGLFPDKQSGVFISLTGSENNDNSLPMKALTGMASDYLLEIQPWLNDTYACSTPAPWGANKTASKSGFNISSSNDVANFHDFEGFYGHPAFGGITITTNSNKDLILDFGRFGKMKLLPVQKDFIGHFIDRLWFVTNGDGKTSSYNVTFVYSQNSVIGLKFPVDQNFERTLFRKNFNPDDRNSFKVVPTDPCVTSNSYFRFVNVGVFVFCIFTFITFYAF